MMKKTGTAPKSGSSTRGGQSPALPGDTCAGKTFHEIFSAGQLRLIEKAAAEGRISNRQAALVLPSIIGYVFHNEKALYRRLSRRYGQNLADILEGLARDLLDGSRDAGSIVAMLLDHIAGVSAGLRHQANRGSGT